MDGTDGIDAALSELEKMLNDGLTSLSPSTGPSVTDAVDNGGTVDCTQVPRLTGQLHYVRSNSLSVSITAHHNDCKLLTHVCLCLQSKQCNLVLANAWSVMLCGWEGNCGPGGK